MDFHHGCSCSLNHEYFLFGRIEPKMVVQMESVEVEMVHVEKVHVEMVLVQLVQLFQVGVAVFEMSQIVIVNQRNFGHKEIHN